MSTRVFRTLVKLSVVGVFVYGIWLYFQRTPAGERWDAIVLGLQFFLVLGAVVGGLWLVDRHFGSRREP